MARFACCMPLRNARKGNADIAHIRPKVLEGAQEKSSVRTSRRTRPKFGAKAKASFGQFQATTFAPHHGEYLSNPA